LDDAEASADESGASFLVAGPPLLTRRDWTMLAIANSIRSSGSGRSRKPGAAFTSRSDWGDRCVKSRRFGSGSRTGSRRCEFAASAWERKSLETGDRSHSKPSVRFLYCPDARSPKKRPGRRAQQVGWLTVLYVTSGRNWRIGGARSMSIISSSTSGRARRKVKQLRSL